MTAVVDTSVLIDHLRGYDRARRLVREAIRSFPMFPALAPPYGS